MSMNNLTPEQDIETRAFFKMIRQDEVILSNSPAIRNSLIKGLLDMLNYIWLPNGVFVAQGTKIVQEFGKRDYSAYPDEWAADEERAYAAINSQITDEASSSSESPYTEIRKALLSKDV